MTSEGPLRTQNCKEREKRGRQAGRERHGRPQSCVRPTHSTATAKERSVSARLLWDLLWLCWTFSCPHVGVSLPYLHPPGMCLAQEEEVLN